MKGLKMKQSNALLVLIFVALVAIFGFMIYENQQEPSVGETVSEFTEEIGDEIDDATTN